MIVDVIIIPSALFSAYFRWPTTITRVTLNVVARATLNVLTRATLSLVAHVEAVLATGAPHWSVLALGPRPHVRRRRRRGRVRTISDLEIQQAPKLAKT